MDATRRDFLVFAGGGTLAVAGHFVAHADEPEHRESDEGVVSAIEDLMREHGVLDRVLLIYEEGMRRIQNKDEVDPAVFQHTAHLVRTFVEDYHERLEEQHLFPLFEKAGRETDLVATLKRQHQAGREVTDRILRYSDPNQFGKDKASEKVVTLCQAFITMYRPHAAREDTVLFPALHSIVSEATIGELGEQFEEQEEHLFGEEGFHKIVDRVANIERQLKIHELAQFSPLLPELN